MTGRKHLMVLIQLAVFAGWISFAFAVPVHAADATAPAFAKAKAESDRAVAKLERMRAQIDRETLSLDNKAAALDYDPDAAIRYVGSDIGFLPYAGSMRGEIGTMATGSGSVLDQALLLGGLLDVMGLDVALAFGELPKADVDRLMRSADGVKVPAIAVDTAAIAEISGRDSALFGPAETEPDLNLAQTHASLMKALSGTAIGTDEALVAALRDDMRNHYVWVMHRPGPADDWVEVHPAFGSARPPKAVAERYGNVAVPEGRAHAMSIGLYVEVTTRGRAQLKPLTITPAVPTARLAARQTEITLAPIGLNPTDVSGVQTFSYAQPLVNGESPSGANAVSPHGETVTASTANNTQSAVASNSLFGDAMQDLGNSADQGHVTAIVMQTNYVSPLGRESRHRVLRDFPDSQPGDALSATDIMTSIVIDVSIGQTDQARVMDAVIDNAVTAARHAPFQVMMAASGRPLEGYSEDPDLLSKPLRASWPAMAAAQLAFTPTHYDGKTVLPVTAQVSALSKQVRGGAQTGAAPTLLHVMDLIMTDAIVINGGKRDAAATRSLGVERTLAESLLLSGRLDANPLYDRSAELKLLDSRRGVEAFAKARKLGASVTKRLTDDVEQSGRVLVATQDIENLHWWKLDGRTGEALGMSVHGGATSTNYTVVLQEAFSNAVSVVFFLYGVWSCAGDVVDYKDGSTPMKALDTNKKIEGFKQCMAVNTGLYFAGGQLGNLLKSQNAALNAMNNLLIDVVAVPYGNAINKHAGAGN